MKTSFVLDEADKHYVKPLSSFWCPLVACLGVIVLPVLAAQGAKVPRFTFDTGQELTYEGASTFRHESGSLETTDRTVFWVTRRNNNGSWHLIVHNQNTTQQTYNIDNPPAIPEQTRESFGSFDIFPDGRIENTSQHYDEQRLQTIFIRLPDDEKAAQAGWDVEKEPGEKQLYSLSPQSDPASGRWVFAKQTEGLLNVVYLSTSQSLVHFDANRGLITHIETKQTQGYGFNGEGSGLIKLESNTTKSDQWIAQLSEEADIIAKAKDTMYHALQSGQALTEARETLSLARDRVELPLVKSQVDVLLQQLDQTADVYARDKALEERPAPQWSLFDLEGKEHSLSGYRGKVIVLDFWYRGCGWCIRAMPQIKEVATYFRDKPVVVLGMNTDRDEKDARFVADKLQLNYPTLKAEATAEQYDVLSFPTLIVIDTEGIVRKRHMGYSPTLREDLIKTIESLLSDSKEAI